MTDPRDRYDDVTDADTDIVIQSQIDDLDAQNQSVDDALPPVSSDDDE